MKVLFIIILSEFLFLGCKDYRDKVDAFRQGQEIVEDTTVVEENLATLIKKDRTQYCLILSTLANQEYLYLENSDWDNTHRLLTLEVSLDYFLSNPECVDNQVIKVRIMEILWEINMAVVDMTLLGDPECYPDAIHTGKRILNNVKNI